MKFLYIIILTFFVLSAYAQNVGINNPSPQKPLHIKGNNELLRLQGFDPWIGFMNVSDSNYRSYIWQDHVSNVLHLGSVPGSNISISLSPNGTRLLNATSSQKVGVGQENPQQKLDVNGKLKVGDDMNTPQAGTIRYNESKMDFEGFNGEKWLSLTNKNRGWGEQSVRENRSITASNGGANNAFGYAVSISGDYALVGAPLNNSVYVYKNSSGKWFEEDVITSSDVAPGDNFGISVFVKDDYAIIGASEKTINGNFKQGKAYIFKLNMDTWIEEAILASSDGTAFDYFGLSVCLDGPNAIIGAIGKNNQSGKIYFFNKTGNIWSEIDGISLPDAAPYDNFGISVSIFGDYAISGAYKKDVGGNNEQGKAYIIKRNGSNWALHQDLPYNDPNSFDGFGHSVSITDNYALVGAYSKSLNGYDLKGKAYVFKRFGTNWAESATLLSSDPEFGDLFGIRLCLDGDFALVSAVGRNQSQGKSYVFHREGEIWTEESGLIASDGMAGDVFGMGASINGSQILIGAWKKTIGSNAEQGKIYFYKKQN